MKFLYILQVAAIAFLFVRTHVCSSLFFDCDNPYHHNAQVLLTLSFLDSMRRLGFLIKSLQMEGFKTVKRFTSLNRILFSTALLYLTAFNGTQAWRFVGFEDRVILLMMLILHNRLDGIHVLFCILMSFLYVSKLY